MRATVHARGTDGPLEFGRWREFRPYHAKLDYEETAYCGRLRKPMVDSMMRAWKASCWVSRL